MNELLLRNVLKTIKEKPEFAADIIDSFSDNQFDSKNKLLEVIHTSNILNQEKELVIFGSWYGSILIPRLADKVKRITCIDLNNDVLKIAKNKFFSFYNNIEYIQGDIFEKDLKRYHDTCLFINTSCEHMPPMKDLTIWSRFNTHFVFQSNNMDYIDDHINCVYSLEEFKSQLPQNSSILFEEEIQDSRGIRYMLVGKTHAII